MHFEAENLQKIRTLSLIKDLLVVIKSIFLHCVITKCVLTLTFDRTVCYENVAFPIVVFSTKKCFPRFSKKVFVFQQTYFKAKLIKAFKISCDFHIQTWQSLKYADSSYRFLVKPMFFLLALK